MKLSILDRLIITKSLLPATGTIEQLKNFISIKKKVQITPQELNKFNLVVPEKGILEINNLTSSDYDRVFDVDFTEKELDTLIDCANRINVNGWITESSLDTIEYILSFSEAPETKFEVI